MGFLIDCFVMNYRYKGCHQTRSTYVNFMGISETDGSDVFCGKELKGI